GAWKFFASAKSSLSSIAPRRLIAPKTERMCVTALTMSPVPASPFVRIMAAPSAIRRSASPRFVQPQTKGTVKRHLSMWFAGSAVVTSMITPPFSISASPLLTRIVPISVTSTILLEAVADEILLRRGHLRLPEHDRVALEVEQGAQALALDRPPGGAAIALDEQVGVAARVAEGDREGLPVP